MQRLQNTVQEGEQQSSFQNGTRVKLKKELQISVILDRDGNEISNLKMERIF
jgi:hypothetical protein